MEEKEQAAEAASREIGKFDSPESLYGAYKALEAEFTKRSQRLRELERSVRTQAGESDGLSEEERICRAAGDPAVKRQVISEYLKALNRGGVGTLRSGVGVAALTPAAKPKSLDEAKKLADIILKG